MKTKFTLEISKWVCVIFGLIGCVWFFYLFNMNMLDSWGVVVFTVLIISITLQVILGNMEGIVRITYESEQEDKEPKEEDEKQ